MKHVLLALTLLAGCWLNEETPHPVQVPPPPPAPPDAGPAPRQISLVTSSVVVDACPSQKKLDRKAATKEIESLVLPCVSVPGGAAHFSVTLMPDGHVTLASPTGDPDEGIVPTCVLETGAAFRHKLKVKDACRFDVKLEERHVH